MQGIINTYLTEKHYGFIKGNDGKDYFFHENDFVNKKHINLLAEEVLIEFEQAATPKGYQAKKCKVISTLAEMKYIQPNNFITTKQNTIKGWEIIEMGEWIISSASSSPDDAKDIIINRAKQLGANALINLKYHKSTESRTSDSGKGTYYYSVHHFKGIIATIGKRNAKGKYNKNDLLNLEINNKAKSLYDQMYDEDITRTKMAFFACGTLLLLSVIVGAIGGGWFALGTAILGLVIGGIAFPNTDIWLEKIENIYEQQE